MQYTTHSNNGSGDLTIRPIHSGLIVSHTHIGSTIEVYFDTVEEFTNWLPSFYREK